MNKFDTWLSKSDMYDKAIEDARKFLQKKFPNKVIVHDDREFKSEEMFKQKDYIIHTYEAETAGGKDAIGFDIEWR
jgi:hypothetical protein